MQALTRTFALEVAQQDRDRGQRISRLRHERAHMSQQELAQKMGMSLRTIQKWEAGYGITAANKRALAEALGVQVEEVMGLTEPVEVFSLAADFREWADTIQNMVAALREEQAALRADLDRQYEMLSRIMKALGTSAETATLSEGAELLRDLARQEQGAPPGSSAKPAAKRRRGRASR